MVESWQIKRSQGWLLSSFFSRAKKTANSPLAGKKLIFLGSSVTKGFAARGRSFVDMIAESTGASCVKEAVSGTTLVDNGERSYVWPPSRRWGQRLRNKRFLAKTVIPSTECNSSSEYSNIGR